MAAVFFIISTTGLAALLLPTSHRVHGATVLSDPCTGASSRVQQGFANMVLDPDDGARSKRRARRQRRQQSTATTGGTSPSAGATPASVVAQAGTEQTLQQAAAAYAKLEQSQNLLQLYEEAEEAEEALPVVIRALLRMRRVELALELYVKHVGERPQAEVDTRSTCSLFLALCRTRRLEDATELQDMKRVGTSILRMRRVQLTLERKNEDFDDNIASRLHASVASRRHCSATLAFARDSSESQCILK